MPCPIRDHHADFQRILQATEPDPEDEAVARLMDPIWEREYQGNGRKVWGSGKTGRDF